MAYNYPYQGGYHSYNYGNNYPPYIPTYSNQLNQQMQNYQQQLPQENKSVMQCEFVDGIEVVKAKNVDLSGAPSLYAKTDGTEIYRKQLNSQTGISDILIYKLQVTEQESLKPVGVDLSSINTQLEQLKQDMAKEITELKDIVLEGFTAPKGGGK